MTRFLLTIVLTLYGGIAHPQEFRPYAQARITEAQWQAYYDEIRTKYAQSARYAPNQPLVVFDDGKSGQYAFTRPGHPAHPSWVARKVVEEGGQLKLVMAGYFSGDEKAFAALFQAYAAMAPALRNQMTLDGQKESQ